MFLALLPRDSAAPPHDGERDWLGPLRSPGIRALVITMLPFGFAIGAIEVSLPAFAEAEGHRELAGLLVAFWSVGSGVGGLVYGARARRSPLVRVHLRMAMLLPLGMAPLALATSLPVMAALALPAGAFVAPLIATRNELAGHVAPPGSETEAFTWPLTALVAGLSLGAAVAGALVDATSWRVPLIVAACTAALGAVIAVSRRRTLEAQAAAAVT
jgi:MFS family permease